MGWYIPQPPQLLNPHTQLAEIQSSASVVSKRQKDQNMNDLMKMNAREDQVPANQEARRRAKDPQEDDF